MINNDLSKKNALVSIIIPAYNAENFIDDTIEDVMKQTYQNIELIVVNDGSKDNTNLKLENLKKKFNNLIIVNKPNGGPSSARNCGLKTANGEYVMFIDSDDRIEHMTVEKCLEYINEYNVDMVIFGMIFEYINLNKLVTFSISNIVTNSNYDFKELFEKNYLTSSCNKLYRKSFITENNIYLNENFRKYEDLYFVLNLIQKGISFVAIKDTFYHYIHRNKSSASRVYEKDNFSNILQISQKLKEVVSLMDISTQNVIYGFIDYMLFESCRNELKSNDRFKIKIKKIKKILSSEEFNKHLSFVDGISKYINILLKCFKKKRYNTIIVLLLIKTIIDRRRI